jgi:hypothetical protein
MTRSIHTTKKDLVRERRYAANDGVLPVESMTQVEEQDIHKKIYKINAEWEHQAKKQDSPMQAEISHDLEQHKRTVAIRKKRG